MHVVELILNTDEVGREKRMWLQKSGLAEVPALFAVLGRLDVFFLP